MRSTPSGAGSSDRVIGPAFGHKLFFGGVDAFGSAASALPPGSWKSLHAVRKLMVRSETRINISFVWRGTAVLPEREGDWPKIAQESPPGPE
ncbi:hypothetical protein GCM10010404_50380 [Nonomuraea africana]